MAKVTINSGRCKACGFCIYSCPKKSISKSGEFNLEGYETIKIDKDKCIVCGICYTVCPDGVFEIQGDEE